MPDTKDTPPLRQDPMLRRQAQGQRGETRGDDPAAGTPEHPISPGEFQPGDDSERAAALGGPVDISPIRGRRGQDRGNS
jgi:hypothetical protein